MINDELRKNIENAQRVKCSFSALTSCGAFLVWDTLLYNKNTISREEIIIVTICAMAFTIFALSVIFCNLGKAIFELEAKNDPTKS